MLELLTDNILCLLDVDIPMGVKCALLVNMFLYSYEADVIPGFLKRNKRSSSDPLISRFTI
jgi:hypothetical protein